MEEIAIRARNKGDGPCTKPGTKLPLLHTNWNLLYMNNCSYLLINLTIDRKWQKDNFDSELDGICEFWENQNNNDIDRTNWDAITIAIKDLQGNPKFIYHTKNSFRSSSYLKGFPYNFVKAVIWWIPWNKQWQKC